MIAFGGRMKNAGCYKRCRSCSHFQTLYNDMESEIYRDIRLCPYECKQLQGQNPLVKEFILGGE